MPHIISTRPRYASFNVDGTRASDVNGDGTARSSQAGAPRSSEARVYVCVRVHVFVLVLDG